MQDLLVGYVGEVGAFFEVVPDETVGAFVARPLPRRVGIGEEDIDRVCCFQVGNVGHFSALVPGQGTKLFRQ